MGKVWIKGKYHRIYFDLEKDLPFLTSKPERELRLPGKDPISLTNKEIGSIKSTKWYYDHQYERMAYKLGEFEQESPYHKDIIAALTDYFTLDYEDDEEYEPFIDEWGAF